MARLEGFKRWAGTKQAVIEAPFYTRQAGYQAMRTFLLKSPNGCPQTAVLCGNDLIALGLKPGPQFAKIMSAVTDAWYENPNISREQALEIVRKIVNL
jgi:hypothetical protein